MTSATPTVAVVAGMHRAGTSAIARSLAVLGFDLGPRLMSADVRMNARGFFEDIDIVALDDAVLAAHGADWKSSALLAAVDWRDDAHVAARSAARDLLAARLAPTGTFACKDPRMPRLLPLWQDAFASLGVHEGYVIAVRHPRAVIDSLTARDGLDPRRSAWLWLTHLACSLGFTQGRPRVVVDYDRMLADPGREVARIARCLGRAIPQAGDPALASFRDDFLSPDLRHAHFASDDIDDAWPPLLTTAHRLAVELATDTAEFADAAVERRIAALFDALRELAPLLDYAGAVEAAADTVPRLQGDLAWATQSLAECKAYSVDLETTVARKEAELAHVYEPSTGALAREKEYSADLRLHLDLAREEIAVQRRALDRLGATRPGRALLRWLRR